MRPTVLVVDDDRLLRQMLNDLLQEAGFRVVEAQDGEEGCRLAAEVAPDAVLMDLVMPRMDGVEACRRLRAEPRFRHTPILLLTSSADRAQAVNPFQVGADDYLAKPFDRFDLVARLQGNLVKKRTIEALERKASDYAALLEISKSVSSSLDTVEILRLIVGRIAGLLKDVYRCSIALIQEDDRSGYVLASSDDPDFAGVRIDLERYPEILEVMRTARPLLIDDVARHPLLASVLPRLDRNKFNTILVLPVLFQQRVIGALVVRALRPQAGISQEEVEFCQLVANVSASALKNAHYVERVRGESTALRGATRRLEDELRLKEVYEQLFENACEGLAAFNRQGEVVYANRQALALLGYRREELLGVSFASLIILPSLRHYLRWQRQQDEPGGYFDVSLRTRDGGARLVSASISAQPLGNGLRVVAFRDVTERRRMEKELRQTKATLEQANERLRELDTARSSYLNTAAHELRIPVTIVNGYCSLLREMGTENLTAQQQEFLDAAVEGSEKLVELINNILDLSRFEAGKMQMDVGPRQLPALVEAVCRDFQPLFAKNSLAFTLDLPAGGCLAVFDVEKIERVLVNLVGNAIKFTPPGGRIRVAVAAGPTEAEVSVEDTGRGIPAERLPDLFDEFAQVGSGDSRQGSGLGLSICKKIIDSHQGRIWVESAPGVGSRFVFTLPPAG